LIRRIVTTEPGSTEVVAYLDSGVNRIVGVSDKCDYPPEVMSKPKVVRSILETGDDLSSGEIDRIYRSWIADGKPLYEVNWSLIEDLDPDLIVGQTLCGVCAFPLVSSISNKTLSVEKRPSYFNRIRQRVIATYSPRTFMGIAREAYMISRIIDREEKGANLVRSFRETVEELRGVGKHTKTIIIEWIEPIYMAGLWASDLVEIAGSKHLIGGGEEGRRVEWDIIRSFDPDLIVISPCGFTIDRTIKEIGLIERMPGWRDLRAVRRGDVYIVDSSYTSRPGPRVVRFAKTLLNLYTGGRLDREVAVNLYEL